MQVLLFSIVAICIAGSRTQEIAIGTDYLRAHVNDTLSSESAIHAQPVVVLPPGGLTAVSSVSPKAGTTSTTKAGTTSTTTTTTTGTGKTVSSKDVDDNSPENDDDDSKKSYDHEHKSHHDHEATVSVDVHNIIDLFKQQLHETEERILAAIHHSQPSSPAPVSSTTGTTGR